MCRNKSNKLSRDESKFQADEPKSNDGETKSIPNNVTAKSAQVIIDFLCP